MKSNLPALGVICCALVFALAACGSGGGTSLAPLATASRGGFAACSSSRIGQAQCDVLIGNVVARPNTVAGLTAADLEDAYKLPSKSKGKGQSVFIVDAYDNPNAATDLAEYRSTMGLPAANFNKYNQEGQKSGYPSGSEGWGVEIDLDTEMVSASCPNCTIDLVEASSNHWSDIKAAQEEALKLGATIISEGYSGTAGCSSFHFAKGVVYLAPSDGTGGFNPPAACDGVIAVGGTDLVKASNKRGWEETLWPGTGGGCSTERKPPWQHDTTCKQRLGNDVAAVADVEIAEYDTYGEGGWFEVGGTSVPTQLLAGIFGLAGNATKQDGGRTFWIPSHHKFLYVVDQRFTDAGGWGSPNGIGAF